MKKWRYFPSVNEKKHHRSQLSDVFFCLLTEKLLQVGYCFRRKRNNFEA
ncbi:hypothetical protein HMPREF1981_01035 [Bacteroides pyogenes F0041]|uniref:Uncharacterized protein n=1 Tax=Bacteroides pyogenes F0041 TaxID=1321819 RepID=U2C6X3_9BACE|nr:hypothetical protein HMPREF1981_01035 [Bacteroides pyogenes F0041]